MNKSFSTYQESKDAVLSFLMDIADIAKSPSFKFEEDFQFARKRSSDREKSFIFTNKGTLIELGIDEHDVFDDICSLKINEYCHSKEELRAGFSPLHVFARKYDDRWVYIKIQIRKTVRGKIFCISFHFAEHPIGGKFPYA